MAGREIGVLKKDAPAVWRWITRARGGAARETCRTAREAGCRAMAAPTPLAETGREEEEGGR